MMSTVKLVPYYVHFSSTGSSFKCNLQSLHSDSSPVATLFRRLLQSLQSHDMAMTFVLLVLLPGI